ncbi:precorrin-6A reductase [Sporomusa malonica]|uniref:Cobalt-precorrin 6A reductase n=1 Tax=Sporomusa malonica TaxID=112901 RepID=A0A1W2E8T6_9FIRM|nr:precorrin-6A reductase [Sporomusa malonica]SMD06151.1 cobalt-precorrin 6A reductase [Sporomusa malonica]
MILVLAGTLDGRELAVRLAETGYQVMVSVISEYGRSLAEMPGISVHTGQLTVEGMSSLISSRKIKAVVDASHPYAVNGSVNAMAACEAMEITYIRYERSEVSVPEYKRLYITSDAAEAAKVAAGLGKVVFLTTGSRTLKAFKNEPLLTECRLIARVLPQPEVVTECIDLGFSPGDIVAMKGPFSHELNVALFREYGTEAVVTKNSGTVGGADTKISAAMELGLPIIMIGRPAIEYRNLCKNQEEVLDIILTVRSGEVKQWNT